ncbi:DUF6316 family protein [Marinobacter pelagius]|uniref:DUF6316 domain-containing protein n=1 Tax=Marinobacter pelagius TaxID=379482 RepID=A0A1I4UUL9_9GAMM|nr:DUF6316 family protein [Marinobacter pelagius]SFM92694.1 hypothetical protein SAMN04487961_1587 [Marinobacter pelagius]
MIRKGLKRLSKQARQKERVEGLVESVAEDPGHIEDGPVKSNRFLKTPAGWFVRTREARDLGPFESEAEARAALDDYLKRHGNKHSLRRYQPLQLHGIQIHDEETCQKQHCALCAEIRYWARSGQTG